MVATQQLAQQHKPNPGTDGGRGGPIYARCRPDSGTDSGLETLICARFKPPAREVDVQAVNHKPNLAELLQSAGAVASARRNTEWSCKSAEAVAYARVNAGGLVQECGSNGICPHEARKSA